MNTKTTVVSALALACTAGIASANVLATLSFSKLNGTYDDNTAMFAGVSAADSEGLFARLAPPAGTAIFDAGDVDFEVNLSVTGLTPTSATGSGTLQIRDVNGVEFSGDIDGNWQLIALPGTGLQAVAFTGVLSNAGFDGPTFEGSTGSFDTDFNVSPLSGAVIQLFIGSSSFFGPGMHNVPVEFDAQIVPAPGALALAALGGLAAVRRRR